MLLPAVTAQGEERERETGQHKTSAARKVESLLSFDQVFTWRICVSSWHIFAAEQVSADMLLSVSCSLSETYAAKAPFFLDTSL